MNTTTCHPTGHVHRTRWLTVLTAMASATAVSGILEGLLGVELVVGGDDSTRHIDSFVVTLTSLGVGFAAWALLTELERHTEHARSAWTLTAVTVLALSMIGPLGATTVSSAAGLVVLHLLVGGILITGMRRSARPPSHRPTDPGRGPWRTHAAGAAPQSVDRDPTARRRS